MSLWNADPADSKLPGVPSSSFQPRITTLNTISLFHLHSTLSPSLFLSSGFIWLQHEDTLTVSISFWDTMLTSLRLMPLVSSGWIKALLLFVFILFDVYIGNISSPHYISEVDLL